MVVCRGTPSASAIVDRARRWFSEARMSAPPGGATPLGRAPGWSSGVVLRTLSMRGGVTSSLGLPPMRPREGSDS